MGSYVIRVKILPHEANADTERILESVRRKLGPEVRIRAHKVEPIAFGISAIILDIVAPEVEGVVDAVEKSVSGAPLVAQYELMGVSRMSSRLPPQ